MKVRIFLFAVGATAAFAAAGCGSPTQAVATKLNIFDTAGVYALTGAPESGPTAVNTDVPVPVRAVPGSHFDVAFDINAGVAIAMPSRAVGYAPIYFGAIQESQLPYDSMLTAPTVGYSDSLPIIIHAGSRFFVQSFTYDPACTPQATTARHYIYSKFIIDSINFSAYSPVSAPNGRTIYYRMVVDVNCGFLGLGAGLPSE